MHVIRPELTKAQWRSSSYSNAAGGDCLEVADDVPGAVPVRDSKRSSGPALLIPASSWVAFVDGVKRAGSTATDR